MKNLEGRFTLLINREYTTIEIEDELSGVRFVKLKLSPEEFQAALSRQAMVKCDIQVGNFDKVGKKQEVDKFEFVLPPGFKQYDRNRDDNELANYVQSLLDEQGEGWIADRYFRSKGSFFNDAAGNECGRATIRRWLPVKNEY